MSVRPRVLLVSPRPPPVGGISIWTEAVLASELTERFAIEGFDTAPRDDATRPSDRRFRPARALRALTQCRDFVRRLRASRPAIVHVATSYHWASVRDAAFVRLARAAGARVVLHLHGGDVPKFMASAPAPLRAAAWVALRGSDRVVAITHANEAWLRERLGAARVRCIPNFVALEPAAGARAERGKGRVVVLFVGALVEAKGVRELVDAVRAAPGIELWLAGPADPAFARALEPTLAALGERVRVLGVVPHGDVPRLLEDADVFALPSHREGLPLALVEAMVAGLPVVVTAVGAIPELVHDGEEGLVVPPGDTAALTRALSILARDPARRRALGARARERALAEHGRAAGLRRIGALWMELLGPPAMAAETVPEITRREHERPDLKCGGAPPPPAAHDRSEPLE